MGDWVSLFGSVLDPRVRRLRPNLTSLQALIGYVMSTLTNSGDATGWEDLLLVW